MTNMIVSTLFQIDFSSNDVKIYVINVNVCKKNYTNLMFFNT